MSFRKLLGLLAVLGVVIVAAVGQHGNASAYSGVGPTIDESVSCTDVVLTVAVPPMPTNVCNVNAPFNSVFGGKAFDVTIAATTPTTDAFFALNGAVVYDWTKVTLMSITSPWATGFTCTPSTDLASDGAGTLTLTPLRVGLAGCSSSANPAPSGSSGVLFVYHFLAVPTQNPNPYSPAEPGLGGPVVIGATAVHMVLPYEQAPGLAQNTFTTYTFDNAGSDVQNDHYTCTGTGTGTTDINVGDTPVPAGIITNPLCPIIPSPPAVFSDPYNSLVVNIVAPPPVLAITKSASAASIIAGVDPLSYTISVSSTGTPATGVVVSDSIPAEFPIANLVGGLPQQGCTNMHPGAQDLQCAVPTLPATITLQFSKSDPTAGGHQPCNTATVTDTNVPGNNTGNGVTSTPPACVNIIPPSVAWSKTPTQGNVWLTNATSCNAIAPDQCNTWVFKEQMTNFQDPHGLGGFSFDIHYDVTQYQNPCVAVVYNYPAQPGNFNCPGIDLSPASTIFASSSPARTLDCTVTIPLNGVIHVACASQGTFGSGPEWTGTKTMANVTMVPQSALVEAIRPNKENGDVSTVKDDQVTVTNSCGQPGNDGSAGSAGTSTAFTNTTLTDSTANWLTNEWIGAIVNFGGSTAIVTSNTNQVLTFAAGWVPLLPGTTPEGLYTVGSVDCQGNPLLGVGPGGVLTGNPDGGETTQTIRRLEGDITGDCKVDVADMQLEASKFGQSVGGLLYNVYYDVNSPLQHGDGEIDINDIQFIFGRDGSNCGNQIPPQPPQPPLP